jgi:geranylgeranyl pyrophosphate synthase
MSEDVRPAGASGRRASESSMAAPTLTCEHGELPENGALEPGRESADVASLLRALSAQVRQTIARELPTTPSPEQLGSLIGFDWRLLHESDARRLAQVLITPIRTIVDRGGKAWRSFALLESLRAVGGDIVPYTSWLAVPELIHVGSLIIDDIQDSADIRRGGATCHKTFGVPLAINAGTAAYFLAESFVRRVPMAADLSVKISKWYFDALRAGHAGQALDIRGVGDALPGAVHSGDVEAVVQRILTISKLKTGIAAGVAAKMGAAAGGAPDAQIVELGTYFETVGVAFQVADDVLNIRGFRENTKQRGEDLLAGKVTFPVARAFGRLPLGDRRALASALSRITTSPQLLGSTMDLVDRSGALDVCLHEAYDMVDRAWGRLANHLSDSIHRDRLKAFGRFAVTRND